MEILIAREAGFCFGVRRAIETAYREREKAEDKPVYTWGPLVHNPEVIQELEQEGIISIKDMEAHPSGHLIIRTHGVAPGIFREAEDLGYTVVDATCPLVKKIHTIVLKLQQEGYPILVIGHAEHPEVQGIVGEVKDNCKVIETVEETRHLPCYKKLGIVVQTTALWHKFREIAMELLTKTQEARIFNTICQATLERQAAAEELAGLVDIMIVIGGKNSSNTWRLLEISKSVNPRAYLVERPEELQEEWFADVNRVGLTAGASTPDRAIKEVYRRIEEIASRSLS